MKIIFSIFVIAFSIICCSTKDTIKLNRLNPEVKNETDRFIRIKLNNFRNFKTEISLVLQDYKSFQSENYKFESQYSFEETTDGEFIDIQIPKGDYVGSLKLTSTNLIPYYKRTKGYHVLSFGLNRNDTTLKTSLANCNFSKGYAQMGTPSHYSFHTCENLELSYNNKTFEFSLSEPDQINPESTILSLFASFSLGTSSTFALYPYAPFLVFHGFFGLTQKDIFIHLDHYGVL
ncbi:hypothetical protein CLV96_1180 [Leptospira meyeri]|uniref:Uncharacterized protein n=1 Tax=Leptospira meyeri TaxID=29508 RepID=A0A4R8MSI6_LEPME|nr:hypothetical protein [Leptospira meyeri]EKJ87075.1 hypothetical protein LEP1GSC017_2775 [Leptospira meyeri serovar Hardjo str. Went 5]TDY72193.1 hypothetical protein CLV96_1180 [Leptospira meyeri]